jgi:hypothetical protein
MGSGELDESPLGRSGARSVSDRENALQTRHSGPSDVLGVGCRAPRPAVDVPLAGISLEQAGEGFKPTRHPEAPNGLETVQWLALKLSESGHPVFKTGRERPSAR